VPPLDGAARAELIEAMTAICARAALAIRSAGGEGGIRQKDDGSPVTAADLAAEAVICDGLSAVSPSLPIISEEQTQRRHALASGENYFLVDPLDGTREFIAGRDEYTINIALMSEGAPILGVIAAPTLGLIWRGIVGRGAERMALAADGKIFSASPIQARHLRGREPIVLISRSHLDARTQAYVNDLKRARTIVCGSSLKFCRIAEGTADLYPRLAPLHDWDVAAGHAIVAAAGGRVLTADGMPLRYGTADLLVPNFVASGAATAA
jgi:3'(2'), 5'-bisphosphate nucleotidase